MRFRELDLSGVFLIEPQPAADERGFFARTFCAGAFAERGLNTSWAQHGLSHNARAGTLRGLHFQRAPHEEAKLVSCPAGAIFDVVVDLRPASPTYCRWIAERLDSRNRHSLYIPAGYAHGFQSLEEASDVAYLISVPYAPSHTD